MDVPNKNWNSPASKRRLRRAGTTSSTFLHARVCSTVGAGVVSRILIKTSFHLEEMAIRSCKLLLRLILISRIMATSLDALMRRSNYAELATAVNSAVATITTVSLFTRLWARSIQNKGLWLDDYLRKSSSFPFIHQSHVF